MSFQVEVIADSSNKWCSSALRFETEEEARGYGEELYCRWILVRKWRVSTDVEPVNATYHGTLIHL